jgi:NADPH:quinone reductase-like Zn-dependent oxidoreductase
MFSKGRDKPNWLKLVWDYMRTPRFNPLEMTKDNRSVLAFNLNYLFQKQLIPIDDLEKIVKWFEEGKIKMPHLHQYPFNEVARAQHDMESGQTTGKLVLTTD